jgi:hypothetical protein
MPLSPLKILYSQEPGETLYESATTRVVRHAASPQGARVVSKTYLGPHAAQRLRNETELLTRLAGIEGLAQIAGQAPGTGFLALRDGGGITLAQWLQQGKCDLDTLVALAAQLARTLAAVHRAGVIHRDINPSNILVSDTHQAVLIDFDLGMRAAQHVAAAPGAQMVGTLRYLAPEQTGRTGRAVDQRADLYALGATLYEMAAGRPPFDGADTLQLIHDHLVREPVSPSQIDPGVPTGFSAIIMRLLAKAPEQRYQSAEGLLHDLQVLREALEQQRGADFELGRRDFPARLAAPDRLLGRDAQLAQLRNALADALQTPRRTALIEGAAGVGKSALVSQLRADMTLAGGWFVQGKFDQYQKDGASAGALTQALRELGRLLLAQPAGELAAQRERILHALGAKAGLATRFPEFALLLGAQPQVAGVDPRQAELQQQQLAVDLIGAIASPGRPLVVVLEDLQWASASALRAFERLMNDPHPRGVLLVGTCRSGDVDAGHTLAPVMAQWLAQPEPPLHIALANLTLTDTAALIGDMLRLGPGPSRELAGAVSTLAGGNPFDTVEMINALRRDGILSMHESGWHWDEAQVRHFVGRGNVVDLLETRISRLPSASRELLESMSCLGSSVDYQLLRTAVGLSEGELRARLQEPLDDGLLLAERGGGEQGAAIDVVRFRHDRVQQALLETMDAAQRGRRQLAMARQLAGQEICHEEAAEQYLACVGMLEDPAEQRLAAQLFHHLATALLTSATFVLAERYLSCAAGLLAAIDEPADLPLRGAVDLAHHHALYSLGRMDEAERLFAAIQVRTGNPLDLVEPACLQINSLEMQGRGPEAMVLGQSLLARLGLDVPPDFSDPHREERLDAQAGWVIQDRLLHEAGRPAMQDPRLLGISRLFGRLVVTALFAHDLNAYTWLLLEGQRLWARHGPCPDLVSCLSHLITVLIGVRQDYRTAYDIARHIITVGEALEAPARTATARNEFAKSACSWFEPVEQALDHAMRAHEVIVTQGDPSLACYMQIPSHHLLLELAPSIEVCEARIDAGLLLCQRVGNLQAATFHTIEKQMLRALRGQTMAPGSFDDAQFSEQEFMARSGRLPFLDFTFARAFQALLYADAARLAEHAPTVQARLGGTGSGQLRNLHAHLFVAMAAAWQIQAGQLPGPGAAHLLASLEGSVAWLAARAADQPYNFLHLLRLVEAEQAWALGELWKAAAAFDAAVLEAASRERPWHRALITERAGMFQLAQGLTGYGHSLLARSRDHYQAWGATAKVAHMERMHVFLQAPARRLDSPPGSAAGHSSSSRSDSADTLDLVGVLRASQVLSSETSLEQLAARVTDVLASLSGATRVQVVWSSEGQWWLLSPEPGRPAIPVAQAAERGLLPLSAFAYAERTGEALIVDDATGDDRFSRDPYFAGLPPARCCWRPSSARARPAPSFCWKTGWAGPPSTRSGWTQ